MTRHEAIRVIKGQSKGKELLAQAEELAKQEGEEFARPPQDPLEAMERSDWIAKALQQLGDTTAIFCCCITLKNSDTRRLQSSWECLLGP